MSAKKLDLTHPLVMGAVVAGLAVVIVVNVRTFGGRKPLRAARAPSGPVISTEGRDALAFLAEAVQSGTLTYAVTDDRPSRFAWPEDVRDPFATAKAGAGASPSAMPAADPRPEGGLRCDAVLLRGLYPVALIGGRPCRVGDSVDGAMVRIIDAGGVELERDGKRLRLAVREDADVASAEWITMGGAPKAATQSETEDGGTR